jgi:hypothetical protein
VVSMVLKGVKGEVGSVENGADDDEIEEVGETLDDDTDIISSNMVSIWVGGIDEKSVFMGLVGNWLSIGVSEGNEGEWCWSKGMFPPLPNSSGPLCYFYFFFITLVLL